MAKGIKKNLINDATIDLLSKFDIMKNLSKYDLRKLLSTNDSIYPQPIAKLIRYEPDEVVIREGDFDSWAYWIVKGSFKVVINGAIIATMSTPGEIFGEMSVLEGIPRTASVLAIMESVCLAIDMSVLSSLDEDDHIQHVISSGFKQKRLERLNTTRNLLIKEKQFIDIKHAELMQLEQALKKKEQELIEREKKLLKREKNL